MTTEDENTQLQYMMCNGDWRDCGERAEEFLEMAKKFISSHPNRERLLNGFDTVEALLESGKPVRIGTDWYDEIRLKPTPVVSVKQQTEICDCGHTVPVAHVMRANTGTACPVCYDKMSE